MLKKMIEQMLPPGTFDEVIQGAQDAIIKVNQFDAILQRIERRLYNIEVDLQTLLTGEAQAEKLDPTFTPPQLGVIENDDGKSNAPN